MTDLLIAPIAAGVKACLDRVSGVGVTFDWAPLPFSDWATFLDRFAWTRPDGQLEVRAWSVAFTGEKRAYRNAGYSKVMREVTFLVRGHLSMREDTPNQRSER